MYLATVYEMDNGNLSSFAVAIYIGRDGGFQQNQVHDNPVIPSVLLPFLSWFVRNPCLTKQIVARYVIVTLSSGDTLQIAYPFKPGSPNWFKFWEQLQSPDVISIKGFGEKITDKFLRNSLGVS